MTAEALRAQVERVVDDLETKRDTLKHFSTVKSLADTAAYDYAINELKAVLEDATVRRD